MSRLTRPTCKGAPRLQLRSLKTASKPVVCIIRLRTTAQLRSVCPGVLQGNRWGGLRVLASCQTSLEASKVSLFAPLPHWCHRLAGAFVLVPFLLFGSCRHAFAQHLRVSTGPAPIQMATDGPSPLYETSRMELSTSTQIRAASALAAAMVGYGFVRSSSTAAGNGNGGSLRLAVMAGTAARMVPADAPPSAPSARTKALQRLANQILELERRNELILAKAKELMEQDSTLGFKEATYKAAESLDLDATAAEEAIAANARTAERRATESAELAGMAGAAPSLRPSGGAVRNAALIADVTALAAAAVAAEVEAGVQLRPSGGASRMGLGGGVVEDSSVVRSSFFTSVKGVLPERPGGASARSGPVAPSPPDSSRVAALDSNMAAVAGEVLERALKPQEPAASPSPPSSPSALYNEPADRPRIRPMRRISGAKTRGAARTFRAIASPPTLSPRMNPSFDVSEDSPSPEDFLSQVDGRTSDGRVNPSFASSNVAAASYSTVSSVLETAPTAAAASTLAPFTSMPSIASASARPVTPEPQWYNPLSWFTQRDSGETESGSGTNPSFDFSLAVMASPESEQQQPQEEESLLDELVRVAEQQAEVTGQEMGVGAAAAASSAAWSEAMTEGAAPNNFTPVEQVAELLQVAMKTQEYTYPKYDPLRNALASATAASAVHKYDMLRGLLRSGKEDEAAAKGQHKYDLMYDLLQSIRTSGEPEDILTSSDPKYDPVWCLLNMRAPARESLSKYDLVASLLQAALAASPQPSRYDPLQVLLQMKPITGKHKYCLASVLLHGGWQEPLDRGLADLPSWDPMTSVVGSRTVARRTGVVASSNSRRTVSKYDMVGQALEAAVSLPEDLASGKWAATQPRDVLLRPQPSNSEAAPRQKSSKYDMVGQALEAAASLPEELSSGKWAATQGRDLFVDTVEKVMEEGGSGLLWRVRNTGTLALDAVTAAVSPVGNMVAKAVGLPYEVAPGVVVKVERPQFALPVFAAGGSPAASTSVASVSAEAEELPTVVFQFKNAGQSNADREQKKVGSAMRSDAPMGKRRQRFTVGLLSAQSLEQQPQQPQQPLAVSSATPRLERAVIPPLRSTGRRVASSSQQSHPAPTVPETQAQVLVTTAVQNAHAGAEVPLLEHPLVDNDALRAAINQALLSTETQLVAPKPTPVVVVEAEEASKPITEAANLAAPAPAQPMSLSELAVDLLVVMSVQGAKGAVPPSLDVLVARFGPGFVEVAAQLQALRGNAVLMGRHSAVQRLVRSASQSSGDGKSMWSHLYDMLSAVAEAEMAMPAFLEDCRRLYPLVHGLLTTGDVGQSVSVLCTLCNLVSDSSATASSSEAQQKAY